MRITSAKSSIGILTHQGHISKVSANGDQNTLPNLSISTEVTKNLNLEGFHLNGDQVSFQNTPPNLSISTQVTKDLKFGRLSQNLFVSRQERKELKIGRLSPVWRPSPFSKYSTKFIWSQKNGKLIGFHQVSFQNTQPNLFVSTPLLLPEEMNILQIQCKIDFNTFLLRKLHSWYIK